MPLAPRRGTTLIELLVALVLLGLLGTVISRLLLVQRRAVSSLVAVDQGYRTADQSLTWIEAELTGLGRVDSNTDLVRVGRDSISYRGWRSTGLACLITPTEVRIRRDQLWLWRQPQPGRDSLAVFLANDSLPGDGLWQTAPILDVGVTTCSGQSALRLTTQLDSHPLVNLTPLSLIRTFEVMQLKYYRSGAEWWLGARSESGGEGLQPLAGPYGAAGFAIEYLDTVGRAASSVQTVDRVRVSLTPMNSADSIRRLIWPRNFP